MQVQVQQLMVSPGQPLLMADVSWQMYEELLAESDDRPGWRVNYDRGMLEIMVPLPEHEVSKVAIGDFIKALLEELDIEFWSLGSTTFKSEAMARGIEADDCFYIENEAAVRGKNRIDLDIDPPPDLAIEIDITSRTRLDNYRGLGVKELWRFDGRILEINILQGERYVQSAKSPHFPGFPLAAAIPQYLDRAKIEGRNATMRSFRLWIRRQINIENW